MSPKNHRGAIQGFPQELFTSMSHILHWTRMSFALLWKKASDLGTKVQAKTLWGKSSQR